MPMMLVWRKERCRMWATLLCATLLAPVLAWAQAPCTHYAAPAGSGNGLTAAAPFRISNFWAVARPGTTLCLLDGTYTGSSAIIEPPTTLHGTAAQPITVRALNDGRVLIDAQGLWAVRLRAQWWVVEGINARNGGEFLFSLSGAHNRARRIIGWNGTHGQADSNIWRVVGHDNTAEDVAGWGDNSRKIFDGAQGGNVGGSGFRRAWGEWNDHPQGGSQPNATYQVSYNTGNQLFENVIGTWNTTGQVARPEAVMSLSRNCGGETMQAEGTLVAGSIFYVAPGASYQPGAVVQGFCASNFALVDVVAYVPPDRPRVQPFAFFHGGGQPPAGNTCAGCLGIHAGTPSSNASNAGWSLPGFREGHGLAAATGSASAFTLLPGICTRYEGGELTQTPLWPWPMDQRIKEARVLAGRPPVDVTATIEGMLGPIPAACRTGGRPPPPVASPAPPPSPPVATPLPPPPDPLLATVRQDLATCRDTLGDLRRRIGDAMQMLEGIVATPAVGGS